VNRLPKRSALNLSGAERAHQLARIHAELLSVDTDGVHPKGTCSPRSVFHRCDTWQILEFISIASGDLPLGRNIGGQLLHLRATDRSQQVGQTIVVAHLPVDVFDRIVFGLGGQIFGFLGPLLIVCNEHTAATRGDDLVTVEAKTSDVSETA
jgi:hypothetical protein